MVDKKDLNKNVPFLIDDGTVDFIPDYLSEISAPNYSVTMAKEWFELEDTNNDGYVSRDELVKIALNIGMSAREAIQTADGYYMIADANGDQKLNWKGTHKINRRLDVMGI